MFKDMLARFAASCDTPNFFGLPAWHEYLKKAYDPVTERCEVIDFDVGDFPLIGLALVDIALRIAALVAVGYIIYAGIQFIIAQGEADKTKKARQTIINALIGLVIAIMSAGIVAFIGQEIGG